MECEIKSIQYRYTEPILRLSYYSLKWDISVFVKPLYPWFTVEKKKFIYLSLDLSLEIPTGFCSNAVKCCLPNETIKGH